MVGRLCLLVLCLAAAGLPALAAGPGDLGVTPHRIVFDERERTAQVTLINRAATAATYRIGFLQMRMTETGQLEEITEPGPGEQFADALLRFSPRQVTLEPGATQTVRLLLRKPEGLPAGEYRSHLVFQSVPAAGAADVETAAAPEKGVKILLIPIFRIAIPVIVRSGTLAAGATLSDLALTPPAATDAPPHISFLLHRTGTRSLYGDVTVTFVPAAGPSREVGLIKGLALYSPTALRRVEIALEPPPGLELRGGLLRVQFQESAAGEKPAVSQAEIALP